MTTELSLKDHPVLSRQRHTGEKKASGSRSSINKDVGSWHSQLNLSSLLYQSE